MEKQTMSDEEPPAKTRRTIRACLQCRARKQRCSPSSEGVSLQEPCKRCRNHGITCSFQMDRVVAPDEIPGPSLVAQLVVELHQRINQHEARIAQLERGQSSALTPLNCEDRSAGEEPERKEDAKHLSGVVPDQTETSHSPGFSIDGINLGPPIVTLRSLTTLAKDENTPASRPLGHRTSSAPRQNVYDPVTRGVLSLDDAQKAVKIFFKHCHPWAPVLSGGIRHSWQDLRLSNPMLFLAICSVGTRFWNTDSTQLHTRFSQLTALLDQAVSRLLLRPTPSDVSLNSIRVLLLYAQWMPCNWNNEDSHHQTDTNSPKSRYNEVSAWAVLGLALRYALFLGLDRAAIAPFQDPTHTVSENDICRLRVWYNLLTCDFNLMLTSGLPASLDPAPSAQVVPKFTSSVHSQQPEDLRVSGLVELVSIVHRAMRSCGDVSGRQLDSYCLGQLNNELEHWERSWFARLGTTESQHNQLPFTSIRWYRLALNSASLGPLLSPTSQSTHPPPLRGSLLQSLEISLTAAAQILLSLSTNGATHVWKLRSQTRSSFPDGPFQVDVAASRRLYYAVDSTWISHTFAVIFLVLCYIRGAVDENLQIRSNPSFSTTSTLLPIDSNSIIARLLHLAQDIFNTVCSHTTNSSFHPAYDFSNIVHGAASLVLAAPSDTNVQDGGARQEIDELALQSLQDLMHDAGLDWPGNLLDMTSDFNSGWEFDLSGSTH